MLKGVHEFFSGVAVEFVRCSGPIVVDVDFNRFIADCFEPGQGVDLWVAAE